MLDIQTEREQSLQTCRTSVQPKPQPGAMAVIGHWINPQKPCDDWLIKRVLIDAISDADNRRSLGMR